MSVLKVKDSFSELASLLRTSPSHIADFFGVSPDLVERLLQSRGEIVEGQSLQDAVEIHYGCDVARKCLELCGVCPFETEKATNQGDGL